MRLFDSHVHLDFDGVGPDALARARDAGVAAAIVPGVDAAQVARAERLEAPGLALGFAVGVHPRFEGDAAAVEGWLERLDACAIGELGWDRAAAPDDALVDALIELARDRDLPVILHVVGRHGHAVERLARHAPLRGVVHAYSGSVELVDVYVKLGLHVSIGPAVLREGAKKAPAAARRVPAERLLVETDAPDQIPEPAGLARVVEAVAAARGESPDAVAERTWDNAVALFGLRG